jgi:hypothetical protein
VFKAGPCVFGVWHFVFRVGRFVFGVGRFVFEDGQFVFGVGRLGKVFGIWSWGVGFNVSDLALWVSAQSVGDLCLKSPPHDKLLITGFITDDLPFCLTSAITRSMIILCHSPLSLAPRERSLHRISLSPGQCQPTG